MDSRSTCALEQIVNNGSYEQLVTVFLKMDEALVGVHDLLEIKWALNYMRE